MRKRAWSVAGVGLTGLVALAGLSMTAGFAAAAPGEGPARLDGDRVYAVWDIAEDRIPDAVLGAQAFVRPHGGRQAVLDLAGMKNLLAGAPMETPAGEFGMRAAPVVISLPRPDGTFERFEVVETQMMEEGLALQFPDIKTYAGQSLDSPQSTVHLDISPLGFRAQVLSAEGSYWIDPTTMGDTALYTSYRKSDLTKAHAWACQVIDDPANQAGVPDGAFQDRATTGPQRRNFRLAVAATGEYTAFFGGTVAAGQAAIVTSINRVNQIYERDLAVRLILIANNSSIVYTNAATDPYTNLDGVAMLTENQNNLTTVIGGANYDVGHVFSTGGGGVASLGSICSASNKARGVTGQPAPTGDAFDIDFVAHELGHQFGALHTFNGTVGSCAGGNRSASAAYEPGSGSTIMAYAGICGTGNLQTNSDAYFHAKSFEEIQNTIAARTCQTTVNTLNSTPSVNPGTAFTIPVQTPYTLTAVGNDPNNDPLTYTWEQYILGPAQNASGGNFADLGTLGGPYQRSFSPTTNPSRQLPRNSNLLANNFAYGETLPLTNRAVVYRVTVRDGLGGVSDADVTITPTTSAGPFTVSSQNSATTWGGNSVQTITWNVANTNIAPVNTTNVDILWSLNGTTFTTVLASNVPNDGSETIVVPNLATSNGRVRVAARGNIFFDINNANITVTGAPADPINTQALPTSVCAGGPVTLSASVSGTNVIAEWFTGGCGTSGGGVLVGTGTSLVVNPTVTTTYFVRARNTVNGGISSNCGSVTVTVNPGPVAPTLASVDRNNFCALDSGNIVLSATGGSGTTLRWFSGSCGGTLVGTGNNLSIPSPAASTTYFARWENSCGVSTCASVLVTVSVCPGDLNCDGQVDNTDFTIFSDAYAIFDCADPLMPAGCPSDLNGDSQVDNTDFTIFFNAYLEFTCP